MESDSRFEEDEVEAAAAEARQIGGVAGDEDLDPAERPLAEAGEGEAEGFEDAEAELIDHASHGDQHSAGVGYQDRDTREEDAGTAVYGEADEEEDEDL